MDTISRVVPYNAILQNVADILTKCDNYFITKNNKSLLQNVSILLQNVIGIRKCKDLITKCRSYYKMRRLLQNASRHLASILNG